MSAFTATSLRNLITGSPALKPASKRMYLADLDRYLAFAGPHPTNWTRATTQRFYQGLLDGGLKPQSANRVLASLAFVGKWYALQQGDANLDFAKIQQATNRAAKPRKILTEAQARALLDTCRGPRARDLRDFALLVIMLETGMRRMSVARMDWAQLPTHPTPLARVPIKRKDELYAVPLSDTALAALAPWKAWCAKQGPVKAGPVFRALSAQNELRDTALSLPAVYHILAERAEQAGLVDVHPHALRHTFVSWRVAAGVPFHVIAVLTGHRLTDGALNTYVNRDALAETARATTPPWLAAYVAAIKRS